MEGIKKNGWLEETQCAIVQLTLTCPLTSPLSHCQPGQKNLPVFPVVRGAAQTHRKSNFTGETGRSFRLSGTSPVSEVETATVDVKIYNTTFSTLLESGLANGK